MSDEEMPPMDAIDEQSDDMGAGTYVPPSELPDGIKKEIVSGAADAEWRKPKKGDEVTVHYVGTLESDGSQFDSSRERGEPFAFTLGKGQVIKGWDLGVATMKKGEVAKFTLAPDFAYGDAGSPPKIPEKATLIFEVELISWVSRDDLFGDGGVIKTQLQEGSGWKTPKDDDEVKCTVRALAADGSVIEEHVELEYKLGSGTFGRLSKAVDKALRGMKKGEVVSLKCTQEYMFGEVKPEGGAVEVTLHEIYECKDVSFAKDKTVLKKQVKEGDGWDTPKDGARATLSVQAATDGNEPLPGVELKALTFTVGSGEVCDALECAVLAMKKGERAVVTCTRPAMCVEEKLALTDLGMYDKVSLTVELTDFEKGKETWNLSEEEKVEFGAERKEVGSKLFKQGRAQLALERYKAVVELLNYIDNFKEETKAKARELKKLCELNKAACHLRLHQHREAKAACDSVLKEEGSNVKALFRRAQADFGLQDFAACQRDVRRVLELEPANREARVLLKQTMERQKEEDRQVKGLFAKMCKGIAKPLQKSAGATAEEAVAEPQASACEGAHEAAAPAPVLREPEVVAAA